MSEAFGLIVGAGSGSLRGAGWRKPPPFEVCDLPKGLSPAMEFLTVHAPCSNSPTHRKRRSPRTQVCASLRFLQESRKWLKGLNDGLDARLVQSRAFIGGTRGNNNVLISVGVE